MEESSPARRAPSGAPAVMGKYAPFARLGNGGMADVFVAVARGPAGFHKLAVIKRLRNAHDPGHVAMFLDEARLAARLSHPNVVDTYEVGESDRDYFIAMEYLDGQPLEALLASYVERGERMPEALAVWIAIQALKGLHYAHELTDYAGASLGVVHRDVSPQNLFLTYRGEVKLLDFGIAKAKVNVVRTDTGVLKGKIRYMAPEQVGERDPDRRVDIFAFGVVLWEMLAGKTLFEGDAATILTRIANVDAPLLRSVRPELSPELDAIVARALRRDRDARYPTADALRVDLERVLRGRHDDASDTVLAALMNERFAPMRDKVRGRIQAFLAGIDASIEPVAPLDDAADLLPPLLGDGSGPRRSPLPPSTQASLRPSHTNAKTASLVRRAPSSRRSLVAGGALLVLAVAFGALVLRSRAATPPPAPVVAAPPVVAPPTNARVHLETTPAGATVTADGDVIGRTPADFDLAPGARTIVLTRDGYQPETLALDVSAGAVIDRALVLTAAAPAVPAASAPPSPHAAHPSRPRAAPAASASASHPNIRVIDDSP